MAKKKATTGFKQDQSIQKRRKQYLETVIGEAVIVGFMGLYGGGSFLAYKQIHPNLDLMEVFSALMPALKQNPIYMFAAIVEKPSCAMTVLGGSFILTLLLELLVLISYFYNRSRIHSDLDTLKGSTMWAEAKDICAKYADSTDD